MKMQSPFSYPNGHNKTSDKSRSKRELGKGAGNQQRMAFQTVETKIATEWLLNLVASPRGFEPRYQP